MAEEIKSEERKPVTLTEIRKDIANSMKAVASLKDKSVPEVWEEAAILYLEINGQLPASIVAARQPG